MVFSNADDEIEKLKQLKGVIDDFNKIEADKLFISKSQLAEMLECSERAAGEFMNMPGFPLIKIGKTPMVNIFALSDFTMQRIDMSERGR